ncbi:MAG: monofunctional biosynthetic peptidoglycan transglycosylase [Prevotellaceae bacterium]|nr:monofunctional biosynthetic peptidoglycan transglycosylase [Prevotellaceae bacterium]
MWIVRKLLRTVRWIVILFLASSVLAVVAYKYVPVRLTPLMLIRCGQQVARGEKVRLRHHWVALEDISPYLAEAVMCTEDANFLKHHGFDFKQISLAYKEGKNGKRQRGASTISQQTAKNVFLWPRGSWVRKGFEAYFTVLIELIWGKRRIMEVYLNSIEMGDGIYGAEAVAQGNFGCEAKALSRPSCALIAVSLPSPLKRDSAHPSPSMLRRQTKVVGEMQWSERTGALGDLSIFGKQ